MATINLLKGRSNWKLTKASKIEPLRNPRIYNSAATTRLTPLYPHIELSTPDEPISHERNPHEHTTSTHSIPLRRLNTKRRSSSVLTTVSSPDVFPIFSSAPPPSWWVLLNFRLKLGHLLIMEVVSRLVSSAFNNGDWWWDGGLVYLKCHSHKYLRSRSSARIEDHSFDDEPAAAEEEGEGDEVESAVRKEERNGILEDPGDIVVSWPFNLETVYVTDYNYFIRFTMIWWYGGECKGRKRKGGRRTVSFSPSFLLTPPPSTSSSGRQMAHPYPPPPILVIS